jgi:hypothetical protein
MHEIPLKLEKFNCFFKPCAPKHLHVKNRSYMTGKLSFCSCPVKFRNDKNIIPSISVTDIVFDDYFGEWNNRTIPKVKT